MNLCYFIHPTWNYNNPILTVGKIFDWSQRAFSQRTPRDPFCNEFRSVRTVPSLRFPQTRFRSCVSKWWSLKLKWNYLEENGLNIKFIYCNETMTLRIWDNWETYLNVISVGISWKLFLLGSWMLSIWSTESVSSTKL